MAKIDYSKAEREISEAIRKMHAKHLAEGKSVTSKRAAEYYGLEEETARPVPEDSVARLLREEAAKEEERKKKPKRRPKKKPPEGQEKVTPKEGEEKVEEEEEEEEELSFESIEESPVGDVLTKAKQQIARAPKRRPQKPPKVLPSEKFLEPLSPLAILRKRLLWMKRLHIDKRYELLGTTKEEIDSFRKTRRLSPEQIQRINELNLRADEVRAELHKKHGTHSDEGLIKKQQRQHKHKRFHIKETWLPL